MLKEVAIKYPQKTMNANAANSTPEQISQALASENFGDRIKAINQLRDIDPAVAFKLIQPLCDDRNTRVRYAAVSQISTLGEQDKSTALSVLTASWATLSQMFRPLLLTRSAHSSSLKR